MLKSFTFVLHGLRVNGFGSRSSVAGAGAPDCSIWENDAAVDFGRTRHTVIIHNSCHRLTLEVG